MEKVIHREFLLPRWKKEHMISGSQEEFSG
jgi:hypothetical protein